MTADMTQLTLTKHHGLGNDFLVVFHPGVSELSLLAKQLCDRRHGIGADGLLVGESADGHSAQMVLYNSDGSRAEISGNGLRCFAQALAMRRGDHLEQSIVTDAGVRCVVIAETDAEWIIEAAVDMGEVQCLSQPENWESLECDALRPVTHLSVGNPHSVVAVDNVADVDLLTLGRKVPQINLEIIEPGPEAGEITMRVHERGSGITQACGTGACASAWAARQWGLVAADAQEIVVHMPGGDAKVRLDKPSVGRATLVGPAQFVGTITIDPMQWVPQRRLGKEAGR
jgi:diaminopimelate epimerase